MISGLVRNKSSARDTAAAERSTSELSAASRKSSPAENTGPAPRRITTRLCDRLPVVRSRHKADRANRCSVRYGDPAGSALPTRFRVQVRSTRIRSDMSVLLTTFICHGPLRRVPGSCISKRIWPSALPWASVRKLRRRAPRSTKFSAPRFGNSNRSTDSIPSGAKKVATRSAESHVRRNSHHSVLRAITPTLALEPLSPLRAQAMSYRWMAFQCRPKRRLLKGQVAERLADGTNTPSGSQITHNVVFGFDTWQNLHMRHAPSRSIKHGQ